MKTKTYIVAYANEYMMMLFRAKLTDEEYQKMLALGQQKRTNFYASWMCVAQNEMTICDGPTALKKFESLGEGERVG